MSRPPRLGVVLIGRNEGERLRRCLASVRGGGVPVVYADSASTDGSADLARQLGVDVVVLDSSSPHTAARGRNAGFEHLAKQLGGLPEFVQFIDGDCELDAGWLDRAVREFDADPRRAIVTGHLREKLRDQSVYARLCDMEWQGPIGEIEACGGIFMIRASAFREVGLFVPDQAVGEEPDLCARLRRAGWKVVRADVPMGVHDAGMTRFAQWWTRTVRAGYFYAQAASRASAQRSWRSTKRLVATAVWTIGIPAFVVAAIVLAPTRWAVTAAAVGLAAYALLLCRIYGHRRRSGNAPRDARLYSLFCVLAKWPELIGQVQFWIGRFASVARPGASHGRP